MKKTMSATVSVVGLALALSACAPQAPEVTATVTLSPSAPAVTDDPEPSPISTANPSPLEPAGDAPAEAQDEGDQGALAAAEYFVGLYDNVVRGDAIGTWEEMSRPECVFCAETVANAAAYEEEGVIVSGGTITLLDAPHEAEIAGNGTAAVVLYARQSDFFIAEAGRPKNLVQPASEARILMDLVREGGAWRVQTVEIQRQEI